jgi:glutaminyl-tRNA synthetase
MSQEEAVALDFVRQRVKKDLDDGRVQQVATRFPPEPNGYLHIGHAKSICLNFGLAQSFAGTCNLRFDDTNPSKEDQEYVDSIIEDVKWLGWNWNGEVRYASDYFPQMFDWACELIRGGWAYVDDQSSEQLRENRGTALRAGINSPFRDRSVEENLDLFRRMNSGEFPEGSKVLRAKIDMAATNLLMRDPLMYRIVKASHHRTGVQWKVYPLYDWAHGLEDSLEGITHSICTLEFETHRPLYDWFLDKLGIHHPQQIEFARLNLDYTMMSKRKLLQLVQDKLVDGWDDPRLPTLRGLRRRGYTPEAIRQFCEEIGLTRINGTIEMSRLEYSLRENLNKKALRAMAVLDPVKVIIDNYPEGSSEELEAVNNPEDETAGMRKIAFCRELYIERDDFMEEPPKKYFRCAIGQEVRLRYAYYITCTGVVKDGQGKIVEIHCTYDPQTRGGSSPDGRKVKGTIHWVSARHAISTEVRLYDHLFTKADPNDLQEGESFTDHINPDSCKSVTAAQLEPSLREATLGQNFQFERLGYFCLDSKAVQKGQFVWNRTVGLKDSWAKQAKA